MNAVLQIIIIGSDKCITEEPRIFFERIVIGAEAEGSHIFDHKHGGSSRVALAEWVYLPNVRSKFRQVFHRCFNRQSLIRKIFFGFEIVIKGITFLGKSSLTWVYKGLDSKSDKLKTFS